MLKDPSRPLTVVMGGAKVSDKLSIIRNILKVADNVIITGAMSFTFLKVLENMAIGRSLFDDSKSQYIHQLIREASQRNVRIYLPSDFTCAPFSEFEGYLKGESDFGEGSPRVLTVQQGIPEDYLGLDIGPRSIEAFRQVIADSKGLVLNGPSGLFEHPFFRSGTLELLDQIGELTSQRQGFTSIIGGGDSVNALRYCRDSARFSHVSTGGGASLEMLEGKVLPGISALSDLDSV